MTSISKKIADNASYQAFVNAYLKEVDSGVWHVLSHWQSSTGLAMGKHDKYALELQLGQSGIKLSLGVAFRSIVGRHRLTAIYQQLPQSMQWQPLDSISAIMLLIREIYARSGKNEVSAHELELTSRTIESHQVMAEYLATRIEDPALSSLRFIDSEQSLLFGHWLHPTPKSRQGMHQWQHEHYAPELKGQFKLHFFAADRTWVTQSSAIDLSAEDIVEHIADKEACPVIRQGVRQHLNSDRVLLAIHPLQAEWLMNQDYIQQLIAHKQLFHIGPLGAVFTPTSSVRTLYSQALDYMVKVSIPVKITNSMRINMSHELDAGVTLAKLLKTSTFSDKNPEFQVIGDPAYLSLALPERQESGFEVIFRVNPFGQEESDFGIGGIQSIASLVQESIDSNLPSKLESIITQLSNRHEKSKQQVSVQWFEDYLACAIEPAIKLFDEFGIALEAHQQNSLLDLTQGYPKTYYYRDNQGFYLSNSIKSTLTQLEPDLIKCPELFYDDNMIYDRCGYYLIINQLFSVINRFGLDNLVSEETLLTIARDRLEQLLLNMNTLGAGLIESLLYRQSIPCKGNLLTRVEDVDELQAENELAVYTQINNPFYIKTRSPVLVASLALREEACLESA